MLINKIKNKIKTKICIIGSGIGGGTLAKKLQKLNKDFVIIEAGDLKNNSDNVNYDNVGRDFGVRTTTTIQLGGTSNLWHGVLAPLDKIDFEKRSWIPHSGWPISFKDIEPFYKEASDVLNVQDYNLFEKENLSDELKKQLDNLPINRSTIKNKLFQQPIPPLNFKDVIVDICENSSKFHCFYNTVALELFQENGSINKLKVGNSDGSYSYVESDEFIICSGALETPRLLLNSNIDNSNIGKYLMDHPMGNLCQIEFLKPDKYPIYSDLKLSNKSKIKTGIELKNDIQKKLKLPNHNFYLRPSFVKGINNESEKVKLSLLAFKDGGVTLKDFWKVISSPNIIWQILSYKYSLNVTFKYADLFFVTEQIPNPSSKVTLSKQKDKWGYPISNVEWKVLKEDVESVKIWYDKILKEIFPKENYKFTHKESDFDWESIYTSAIHHVGTARMSNDKNDGVVDKNLKVFGIDNLFICDGSVFTTAGNVNNGLTISALACKLVNHLINK